MRAELLAALIADERMGRLARGNGRCALLFGTTSGSLSCFQLLQRLVLILLQPVQGLLHCVPCQQRQPKSSSRKETVALTSSRLFDGELGPGLLEAHLEQEVEI